MLGEYSPGRGSPVVWTMAHRLLRTAFVSRPDHGAWRTHRICIAPGSRRLEHTPHLYRARITAPANSRSRHTAHRPKSRPSGPLDHALEHFVSLYPPHLYRARITAPESIRSRHGSSSKVTALRPSRPRTRAFRVSLPGPGTSRSSLVLLLLVAQAPTEQQRLAQGRARPQKCSVGTRARVALSPAQRI